MIADKNRLDFMMYLIDLCEKEQKYNDLVRYKSIVLSKKKKPGMKYIEQLYDYWATGKDLKQKLEYDYQVNENEIKSLQKTLYEV